MSKELIWNTRAMSDIIRDGIDVTWKIEILPPTERFETSKIMAYHPMFGKKGPHLIISGIFIPRVSNQEFDPNNCVIDGINLGDNYDKTSLSPQNQHTFLAPVYKQLMEHLKKSGFDSIFDHTSRKRFDDNFKFE